MKIKYLHIVLLLLAFLCPVVSLRAQVALPDEEWIEVDFKDTTLISSQAFSAKMVDYLFRTTTDGDMKRFDSLSMISISNILERAKVNMRVYEYVLDFMLNGYTNMGRTQVVDYLLNYPMLSEGEVSVEEGHRLDSITEPYQLVKVGAKAPDFMGVGIEGETYQLYRSEAKRVLVVFWSTDCEYCHDFLTKIRRHLDLKSDYELVTFALADSQEEVAETVRQMRLPGHHFYDPLRWESKAFLDYHITSTPTVFLLDAEKNIVCKPYDWDELKLYIKSNK